MQWLVFINNMIGTGIVDLSGHVYVISFEYLSTGRLDRNEKAFHECLIVESGQDRIYRNELRVKTFTEREDIHVGNSVFTKFM